MQIAMIGTGNVGQALGSSFVRAGHRVTFAGRDFARARRIADELGASAAQTTAEAVADAHVVVLAVPFAAATSVARSLADSATGTVVVDVTNPLKPDMSGLSTEGGPSAGEQIRAALPGAAVAKAFNTVFASLQEHPDALGVTLDAFFATDDARARSVVRDLITSIGFRAVDAGPLTSARELESLAWLNMKLQLANEGDWKTGIKFVGAPAGATTERIGVAS